MLVSEKPTDARYLVQGSVELLCDSAARFGTSNRVSGPEHTSPTFDIRALDELTGTEFERALAHVLEAQGLTSVELTSDRGDFGADILGLENGEKVAVQAKRAINAVGVAAVQEVLGGVAYWGAERGVVITNSFFSPAARELAARANVQLVDRTLLKEWLREATLTAWTTDLVPLPHQEQVLERLSAMREAGETRALAVMASGLGKTYVSALDARQYELETDRPIRVLYLSHQAVILQQGLLAFERVFGPVRTYGRFDGTRREPDADFVFGTFQSVYPALDRLDAATFDYLVVDEAHHTAAPTRDAVVSHFRPSFMLGLTATPLRGDGLDIAAYYGDAFAASIPLERAVVEGLLTPIDYRVVADPVEPDALQRALTVGGNRNESIFRPQSDAAIVETVLREAHTIDGQRRVLIFCSSLAQMDHFAELFPGSRTISSRDSRQQQLDTIEALNGADFEILLSRDVLNEGIDIPHATTLVFLRNTESPVVFLQQLGRGLRKIDGKDRVVVLDFVSNIERIEFVYEFVSHLQTELRSRRARSTASSVPRSVLTLNQTARDVVEALLKKKRERGFVVGLDDLAGGLNHRVSPATLRRIIDGGRLVPDYVLPRANGRDEFLFEQTTVMTFMRQIQSRKFFEGLLSATEFAKRIKQPASWVRSHQERGTLPAAWVHQRPDGRYEVFFDPEDIDEHLQERG